MLYDVFHNPNETSWEGIFPEESTYEIPNFLSQDDINFIIDWYYHFKKEKGFWVENGDLSLIDNFYKDNPILQEILFPELTKHLGEFKLYNEITQDKVLHTADFIMEQTLPFGPHTDAITHIDQWLTWKDVIIPLWIENDAETWTYAFDQRCYLRATHFRKGSKDQAKNVYSNVLRTSYDIPSVKYLNGNEIDYNFIEKHVGSRFKPEWFEGMTLESEFQNIPGNIIVKDSSVIHGPSNYRLTGAKKKLNISLRLFKHVDSWHPDTTFSYIHHGECTQRAYYNV